MPVRRGRDTFGASRAEPEPELEAERERKREAEREREAVQDRTSLTVRPGGK